jgi:structural maintenance of chromosomes protein 5
MNMIIGPNGTGKSTVVAAIALGLGASPAVMGRSKNVTEFIKYNTSESTIEIVLKCEDPLVKEKSTSKSLPFAVIKRVLRKTKIDESESDWFINGNITNQKMVVQFAQDLGVQISNLCQFLPQDRVSEFAQLTQEKMLEATMLAAAPEETIKQFRELCELKKEEKELSSSLKKDQDALTDDQKILKDLQVMRQKFQAREERRKRIELLKRKRPWALYHQARNKYNELKVERDRLRDELEAATLETDQELYKEIKEIEGKLKISAKKVKQLSGKVFKSRQEAEQVYSEVSHSASVIKDRKAAIIEKRKLIQKTQENYEKERQELRQTDEIISRMKQEMESNEIDANVDAADQEIKRLSKNLGEVESNLTDLTNKKERIASRGMSLREIEEKTQARIAEVKNIRNRRLDALARMNQNTAKVLKWLNENPERFQGRIMGPIALDVHVKDEKLAQAIESVVSRSVLSSFYCTRVEDIDEFNRIFEEKKWNVNIMLLEKYQTGSALPETPWTRNELKSLGFDCVLSDLIEAPEMVMWALHDHSKIHLIPVCLSNNSAIDVVGCERIRGLMKFLSLESFFEIKRSRYNDQDVAMKSCPLKKGFLLSMDSSANNSELPELQKRVDSTRLELQREHEKMKAILSEIDAVSNSIESLKKRIKECQELKGAALVKLAELKKQELKREKLKRSVRDSLNFLQNETDESESLEELKDLIKRRAELLIKLKKTFKVFKETVEICGIEEMSSRLDSMKLKQLEAQMEQRRSVNENLRKRVEQSEQDLSKAKDKAQELLNSADIGRIDADMRKALSGLSDDLEVIDRQIVEEETLLMATGTGDRFGQSDLEELEKRAGSVQELEQNIEETKKKISVLRDNLTEIGGIWKRTVDEIIAVISGKFERFFSKIGCAGKVTLGIPQDDPSDYSSYSLSILVKFRDTEDLQRLTGQRQSGGEKSVSTILYLLSLQELSRAPFRVVDEINQGMDTTNERKIHALIVETATETQVKQAQYFLITPKLLTGLEYHEKMHILCIFNGPGVLGD